MDTDSQIYDEAFASAFSKLNSKMTKLAASPLATSGFADEAGDTSDVQNESLTQTPVLKSASEPAENPKQVTISELPEWSSLTRELVVPVSDGVKTEKARLKNLVSGGIWKGNQVAYDALEIDETDDTIYFIFED